MEKIIKKNQFVVIPADTDLNEKKYEAWQTLRDSGMSCKDIAKMFDVCYTNVYAHTKMNIDQRKFARGVLLAYEERKAYYVPLMLELRDLGYSNVDIAKKTGFAYKTVCEYIGEQPDEITLASMRAAGAKRRFRNLAKKNQPCRDNNEPIPAVAEILKSA
ncbi:MAG: hypothetical protein IKE23_08505 [Exiguobacterium sp.]|nr:hypothetical protein [Exiguobacterium sp.]